MKNPSDWQNYEKCVDDIIPALFRNQKSLEKAIKSVIWRSYVGGKEIPSQNRELIIQVKKDIRDRLADYQLSTQDSQYKEHRRS